MRKTFSSILKSNFRIADSIDVTGQYTGNFEDIFYI